MHSLRLFTRVGLRPLVQQLKRVPLRKAATVSAFTTVVFASSMTISAASPSVDYAEVRTAIADVMDDIEYEDGSLGPLLLRLAWHCAGTYDKETKTGGSNGANMRFKPESSHGANAGLHIARSALEPIKKRFPGISYADLYTLAGAVAVEECGGPTIKWRPGRTDNIDGSLCTPDGRLPDASQGAAHLREIFYRMGFNDREIVALSGAHTMGRCHTDRSGFSGPWTRSPTTFSNSFFVELLNNKWSPKKWKGPSQMQDVTGDLMMLSTDMALTTDPVFKTFVAIYAKDQSTFFQDFASAFSRMLELGVPFDVVTKAATGADAEPSDFSKYKPVIFLTAALAFIAGRQ